MDDVSPDDNFTLSKKKELSNSECHFTAVNTVCRVCVHQTGWRVQKGVNALKKGKRGAVERLDKSQ